MSCSNYVEIEFTSPGYLQVYVLHHIIDVCGSLKEMRDFTSLKALLSATRAALGHTQLTSLSWNVSMTSCSSVCMV